MLCVKILLHYVACSLGVSIFHIILWPWPFGILYVWSYVSAVMAYVFHMSLCTSLPPVNMNLDLGTL